jgi:Piezo non-specific cation channel, R-Ras-binding domain
MAEGILGETLSKFSIWSLYITFVLAVARFIRLQCSDLRMRIPYENLPSCDRYQQLETFLLCFTLSKSPDFEIVMPHPNWIIILHFA